MVSSSARSAVCACKRKASQYCPDEPVPADEMFELSDEMKEFLLESRKRRLVRDQERREQRAADLKQKEQQSERDQKQRQAQLAELYGDRRAEIKQVEQEMDARFQAAVAKTGAVLWPAVALSFGRS